MNIKNVGLFFGENPNPMWIYDPSDLLIKEVNQSALELYGYTCEELKSSSTTILLHENEIPRLKEKIARNIDTFDDGGIWKHRKKNGDLLFVRVLTNPISYKEKEYKLVMAQDVTHEIVYKERYQELFENSLDGMMLTKPSGEILKANRAACDILGMEEDEIIRLGRDGLVVKDQNLKEGLRRRSETGFFAGELTFIHKSGKEIPVELTSSVFENVAGETHTSLVFRDISGYREAEKAILLEKEFNDITINSIPGVFFVVDQQGRVIRWNNNSLDVFGLEPEEIQNRPAIEFAAEEDRGLTLQEMDRVFKEGSTNVELKLKTAGNNTAIYSIVAKRFRQNDETYIVGAGIDITQQKKLEEEIASLLKEEHNQRKKAEVDRDRLRAIYEHTPSPKCLLEGPEFRYAIANQSYKELVGKEEIIGRKLVDVIPEIADQGYIDILEEVYRTGQSYVGYKKHVWLRERTKNEYKDYIMNMSFQPLFDEEGEVYGIFVEAVDLSEQLAYQEQLEESLKEKKTLLAEIHHRVKNNLAVITGMMELQALENTGTKLQALIRTCQQRVQTIAIIHEILYQSENLSHVDFGSNVRRLTDNIHEIYGNGKQISIDVHSNPFTLNINQAIPCALIINELITNAYKHAFEGRDSGQIYVTMTGNNKDVKIKVSDNGIGIPLDVDIDNASSTGMTLTKVLKQQLEADIKMARENGTQFFLEFKRSEQKGSANALIN